MPIWLSVVLSIIGAIGTIFGILGVSAYMGERAKRKAQKHIQEEEHVEALRHQEYEEMLRKIIREENSELSEDIASIKSNLALNTKGTVTLLRNDMKKSLDKCRDRGYATTNDKANWNELVSTYEELGGNHFREYVNAWKAEMDALPIKPKTKKRLVESKK